MDLIVESLQRLDALLHKETPAVIDLWNEVKRNIWKPKSENELSDYIKRHLDHDLAERSIVVNREVRINRGESTDLRIE